jgi:hypothetical protein
MFSSNLRMVSASPSEGDEHAVDRIPVDPGSAAAAHAVRAQSGSRSSYRSATLDYFPAVLFTPSLLRRAVKTSVFLGCYRIC